MGNKENRLSQIRRLVSGLQDSNLPHCFGFAAQVSRTRLRISDFGFTSNLSQTRLGCGSVALWPPWVSRLGLCLWLTLVFAASAADAPDITKLIAQLGAHEFAARQAAQTTLIELGNTRLDTVLDQAGRAYARADDPEVRSRLREVLHTLVVHHIIDRPRGFLGIHFNRALRVDVQPPVTPAIEVVSVTADSAADKAGLQVGDRLLRAGDLDLTKDGATEAFVQFIQSKPPGTPLTVELERGGEKKQIPLKLGELPAEMRSQFLTEEHKEELFQEWLRQAIKGAGAVRP